jgi:alginate O-acetyltransferase complex protein AlgI
MLFNTIDFVIFFIVVLTTIVIVKNRKFQHLFLLYASYFFFYYSSNYLIMLLIFTTLWDFFFGRAIWKTNEVRKKKAILICSLAGNLGLLGFFKYADFAITQFNFLGNYFDLGTHIPLLNLALPIGISFYTFHSITYTVGIYRGIVTPVRLREYALFVTFFPQLVAGPILRANQFLPQLREKIENSETTGRLRQIIIHNSNLKFGITMMAFGFLKKMFFADHIAPMVNYTFSYPIGLDSFTIILGAIGFGIQIYCDFSGYTDIAIGAAMILGFKLPANFNKPYFAISPSDFWRRWHISLSSWLRDYLYIPLGGNRKSHLRTYLNLFIVMFLGGLWHGASWNFVIWGILHGTYLAIHKTLVNKFPIIGNHSFFKSKIGIICSVIITQYFVFLAWIPFRVKDTTYMLYSMQKYVVPDFHFNNDTLNFIVIYKIEIVLIILFIILHFISYKKGNLSEKISNIKLRYWFIFLTTIILAILFSYDGHPSDFIYFQF